MSACNGNQRNRACKSLVKFSSDLACKHGVRLSALVAHIVGWLRDKRQTDANAYEYDPCSKFGEAIGVSRWQVYHWLKKAKKAGLLDYRRSLRQVKVRVIKDSLFNAEYTYYYNRDLARLTLKNSKDENYKIGINASILYAKIYEHTARPEPGAPPGYRASYMRWVKKFPWMTEASVKKNLVRLRQNGLIDWDQESCHFTSTRYFVTQVFEAPPEESSIDTLCRVFKLKPDLVHPAPSASQGQTGPGHKSGNPQSGGGSGKLYYNLDEE